MIASAIASTLAPLRRGLLSGWCGARASSTRWCRLFEQLNDKEVMAVFRRDARGWHPDMPDLSDGSERAVVAAIQDAQSKWHALKAGKPIERLRTHRNRHLAHTLIEQPDAERAVYDDIFKLLDGTSVIVKMLLLGVLGKNVDVDEIRRVRGTSADAFWSSAVAGVLANRTS